MFKKTNIMQLCGSHQTRIKVIFLTYKSGYWIGLDSSKRFDFRILDKHFNTPSYCFKWKKRAPNMNIIIESLDEICFGALWNGQTLKATHISYYVQLKSYLCLSVCFEWFLELVSYKSHESTNRKNINIIKETSTECSI